MISQLCIQFDITLSFNIITNIARPIRQLIISTYNYANECISELCIQFDITLQVAQFDN